VLALDFLRVLLAYVMRRTMSTGDVDTIFAPITGIITYRDGLLLRRP
jgi:hypothetical protein